MSEAERKAGMDLCACVALSEHWLKQPLPKYDPVVLSIVTESQSSASASSPESPEYGPVEDEPPGPAGVDETRVATKEIVHKVIASAAECMKEAGHHSAIGIAGARVLCSIAWALEVASGQDDELRKAQADERVALAAASSEALVRASDDGAAAGGMGAIQDNDTCGRSPTSGVGAVASGATSGSHATSGAAGGAPSAACLLLAALGTACQGCDLARAAVSADLDLAVWMLCEPNLDADAEHLLNKVGAIIE